MAQTEEIAKAIAGLRALIDQLQSGHLKLLFARAGDAEWSDGAEQLTGYYQQLLSLLETIRENQAQQGTVQLRRRKARGQRKAVKKRAKTIA